ncbi:MAG: hypothetical protein VZS44_08505 [Bacilli bacterium]|nr:hypothetical protein [Bacilli bacterium]
MHVDVEKLKIETKDLIQLNDVYNNLCNNYYSELNKIREYWHDAHANYFFKLGENEKIDCIVFNDEYKNIRDLYDYIIKKYSNIGNKVEFNLDNKDTYISDVNKYVKYIDTIINNYRDIDFSFDLKIRKYIDDEVSKYVSMRDKIFDILDDNKTVLTDVEDVERQVASILSKLSIMKIKPSNRKNLSFGFEGSKSMDISSIEVCLKKMVYYVKEEEINYESISDLFDNINYNYDTSNRDDIDSIFVDFLRKYKIIIENHKNNIALLNTNINNYREGLRRAIKALEGDING